MKLRDGLTHRQRKRQKGSTGSTHSKRVPRIEYTDKPGTVAQYMDNAKGISTTSLLVGKVNKRVAKARGTF